MYTAISVNRIWRFPKIGGTILRVPIIRIVVFGGSILGSPYFGKLPFRFRGGGVRGLWGFGVEGLGGLGS